MSTFDFSFRGFGFVTFSGVEGVEKVLAHGTHDLDGKKVYNPLSSPNVLSMDLFFMKVQSAHSVHVTRKMYLHFVYIKVVITLDMGLQNENCLHTYYGRCGRPYMKNKFGEIYH